MRDEQAAELRELAGSAGVRGRPRARRPSWPRPASAPARSRPTIRCAAPGPSIALGPGLAACFVACESEDGTFQLATSYDRDLVVESALLIMARLRPLAPPAR